MQRAIPILIFIKQCPTPPSSAEAKLAKRNQLSQQLKSSVQTLTNKLPEAVIISEPKEEELPTATAYVRDQFEVEQEAEIRQADKSSPFRLIGKINDSIAELWTALTGLEDMPHMADDGQVKNNFIKTTRDFRKTIANGTRKAERVQVHNWIVWLEMALEDMRETLEKAEATAYDR